MARQREFDETLERAIAVPLSREWLMVNAVIDANRDARVEKIVAGETEQIEAIFEGCVAAAQASQISREESGSARARQLLSVLLGMRVLARVRPDLDLLQDIARSAVTRLGVAAGPSANYGKE